MFRKYVRKFVIGVRKLILFQTYLSEIKYHINSTVICMKNNSIEKVMLFFNPKHIFNLIKLAVVWGNEFMFF